MHVTATEWLGRRFVDWCWAGFLCLGLAGCSLLGRTDAEPAPTASRSVRLTYRSDTDRLNVRGGAVSNAFTGYQPGSLLPNCAIATLNVVSPHPDGKPGLALVTVVFHPAGDSSAMASDSILKRLTGQSADEALKAQPGSGPHEVWVLDAPQWQVDAIASKIKSQGFFRRSKVLDAEIFLAAQIDNQAQAKNAKALSELDALVLRARMEGKLASGGGLSIPAASLASLPPNAHGGPGTPPAMNGAPWQNAPPIVPPANMPPGSSYPPGAPYAPGPQYPPGPQFPPGNQYPGAPNPAHQPMGTQYPVPNQLPLGTPPAAGPLPPGQQPAGTGTMFAPPPYSPQP